MKILLVILRLAVATPAFADDPICEQAGWLHTQAWALQSRGKPELCTAKKSLCKEMLGDTAITEQLAIEIGRNDPITVPAKYRPIVLIGIESWPTIFEESWKIQELSQLMQGKDKAQFMDEQCANLREEGIRIFKLAAPFGRKK